MAAAKRGTVVDVQPGADRSKSSSEPFDKFTFQAVCLSNALPFSSKPAAESAPRCYTRSPCGGIGCCNGLLGGLRALWSPQVAGTPEFFTHHPAHDRFDLGGAPDADGS